ncbi:MAG: tyrosine-type recombinase/integrase [Clostridiales bacterium]|nr:tyrosine-type recombinase/integrase [Clostridiales bacterium]
MRYGSLYIENIFDDKKYNLIFTKECGEYIIPSRFLQRLKRRCNYYNINKNIRWHDLRHTNATLLIKQGVNMKIIQERLGHAQFSTTADIYSHVTQDMNREATQKLMEILK